jgi:membrane protein DedA with SNARE-associated domain
MKEPGLSTNIVLFLSGFSGVTAYSAILGVLLLCGLGLPLPEDITLIAAGVLAALGNISLQGAIIAGFIGVLIGDTMLFFLGRRLGHRVFKLPLFNKIFTERRIAIAEEKIRNNSRFICFTARFLPGLRAPIYLMSGVLGVKPIVFITLDGFAALISVPAWVWVGFWFGENLDHAFKIAKDFQYVMTTIIVITVSTYFIRRHFRKKRELAALTTDSKLNS